MERDIFKTLKELRKIEPESDYAKRSRSLILSYRSELEIKPNNFFGFLRDFQSKRFAVLSEVMAIFVVASLAGVYYFKEMSRNSMVVQADELNNSIQLKINEINYLLKNQSPTSTSDINSLKESLKNAETELNQAASNLKGNNLEDSLAKIKSTEKMFQAIEARIKESRQK